MTTISISDLFGINCATGMSALMRKELLDNKGGFEAFGCYLAEDFFFAQAVQVLIKPDDDHDALPGDGNNIGWRHHGDKKVLGGGYVPNFRHIIIKIKI